MAAFWSNIQGQHCLGVGLSSTTDTFASYGERIGSWTAEGPTGHGSRFIDNTAVEQLIELANKALAFREGQRKQLGLSQHENCAHAVAAANSSKKSEGNKANTLGDVTSLNITTLSAVSDWLLILSCCHDVYCRYRRYIVIVVDLTAHFSLQGVKVGIAYNFYGKCSLDIRISPRIGKLEP
jgi:hypothetical protein